MEIKEIKKLVADENLRIELHDKIAVWVYEINSQLNDEDLSVNQDTSDEEFKRRVKKYEEKVFELSSAMSLVSYWGSKVHLPTILLPFRLMSGEYERRSGKVFWLALRWYPIMILYYYCGISLVSAGKYSSLKELCDVSVPNPYHSGRKEKLNQVLFRIVESFEKPFSKFLENKRTQVPLSEYFYFNLKSRLNELIYLESDYESLFDEFEILTALEYAHQTAETSPESVILPSGRFTYKFHGTNNPLSETINGAKYQKNRWLPLKAGFFNGDFDRFDTISSLAIERLNKLW